MNNSKKPNKIKTAVQTAENKPAEKEASASVVKTETKTTSAAKNTAKKPAVKTETAAKKTAAKAPAKKSDAKTTAKSAAKTTAKKAAKETAKTAAAKAPAKRGGRKPAPVTINTICTKTEKKIDKRKASAIKEKIAVEIEVWGFEDGSNAYMYIEVNEGKVTVAPHDYKEKSFRVSLSFANAVAFVDGKIDLNKLIVSGDFYADGNIGAAVKLAAIF